MKRFGIILFLFFIARLAICQTLKVSSFVNGQIDPAQGTTVWADETRIDDMYFSLNPEKNKIMIFSSKGCNEFNMIDYPGENKDVDHDLYQIELLLVDINKKTEHVGAVICEKGNNTMRGFILYSLDTEYPTSNIYFFE